MFDEFLVHDLLAPDERLIRQSVRAYCDAELMPQIAEWWDSGDLPVRDLMQQFGGMGLLGPTTPEEYGGAGVSYSAYGAMMYELERVDSGLRSAASVQGSLVMFPMNSARNTCPDSPAAN
jgi:glutaryl-CoA dehydrogenase